MSSLCHFTGCHALNIETAPRGQADSTWRAEFLEMAMSQNHGTRGLDTRTMSG